MNISIESPNMNTPHTLRPIAFLAASLSVALGLTLGMSLSTGAADAPKKGAERLGSFGVPLVSHEASANRSGSALHSNCGSCTTVTTVRPKDTAKGGEVLVARGKPTTLVSSHGCGGCSTTLGISGFGKAKAQTVTHGCTQQTLASVRCCQ